MIQISFGSKWRPLSFKIRYEKTKEEKTIAKTLLMYLRPKTRIYIEGEHRSSPEQLGDFDLSERALESILWTVLDPH